MGLYQPFPVIGTSGIPVYRSPLWAGDQDHVPLGHRGEQYLEENHTQRLKLGSPQYKEIEPYRDDEVYAMLN